MHEASIVTALLARVEAEAAARGAARAHRVELQLGELAGVEPELLLRAWEVFRTGTVCDGAELAVALRCGSCHLPTLAGQDQMPRLAKQRVDYLIPTLKSYRDSPRPGADTAMSVAVTGASDADLAALAHYAASR